MSTLDFVDQCEAMYNDGYAAGLQDGLGGTVVAHRSTRMEWWKRLALAWGGIAMVLMIALIVETVLLVGLLRAA